MHVKCGQPIWVGDLTWDSIQKATGWFDHLPFRLPTEGSKGPANKAALRGQFKAPGLLRRLCLVQLFGCFSVWQPNLCFESAYVMRDQRTMKDSRTTGLCCSHPDELRNEWPAARRQAFSYSRVQHSGLGAGRDWFIMFILEFSLLCRSFFELLSVTMLMVCAFGPPQKIRSLQGRSVKEQLAEFVGDAQQRENVYLVLPGVPVNTNPVNDNQIWEVVNGCLMQVSLM